MSLIGETTATPVTDLIKEGTDASFMADVIEARARQPVIVDFWATWCGPCRQLTPALEKAVAAAKGAVKLVKIDVDKNPVYAGQLRVQSIPTVYAFVDGKPVDGFMGALPDSQVKAFIDKLIKVAGRPPRSTSCWPWPRSRWSWATSAARPRPTPRRCSSSPTTWRPSAAWPAAIWPAATSSAPARWPPWPRPGAKDADLDSVRAALALAAAAPSETGEAERRLAADPDDHEARLELAKALAGKGKLAQAADQLLDPDRARPRLERRAPRASSC